MSCIWSGKRGCDMAKVRRVSIDKLSEAIAEELKDYAYVAEEVVNRAVKEAAEELAGEVRASAPTRTGTYKSQIAAGAHRQKGEHKHVSHVYVDGDRYRIGHLLEHGHASRNGGRVNPSPRGGHWKPAAEKAPEVLARKIKEGLK